jgi:hypothetical protein
LVLLFALGSFSVCPESPTLFGSQDFVAPDLTFVEMSWTKFRGLTEMRLSREFSENRVSRKCQLRLPAPSVHETFQPRPEGYDLPGFWTGLFRGFLIVFSFIGSLFNSLRIYSFPNSGGWYDLGYVLGASMFLGGTGTSGSIPGGKPRRRCSL